MVIRDRRKTTQGSKPLSFMLSFSESDVLDWFRYIFIDIYGNDDGTEEWREYRHSLYFNREDFLVSLRAMLRFFPAKHREVIANWVFDRAEEMEIIFKREFSQTKYDFAERLLKPLQNYRKPTYHPRWGIENAEK